jgi:hypothetical protein
MRKPLLFLLPLLLWTGSSRANGLVGVQDQRLVDDYYFSICAPGPMPTCQSEVTKSPDAPFAPFDAELRDTTDGVMRQDSSFSALAIHGSGSVSGSIGGLLPQGVEEFPSSSLSFKFFIDTHDIVSISGELGATAMGDATVSLRCEDCNEATPSELLTLVPGADGTESFSLVGLPGTPFHHNYLLTADAALDIPFGGVTPAHSAFWTFDLTVPEPSGVTLAALALAAAASSAARLPARASRAPSRSRRAAS